MENLRYLSNKEAALRPPSREADRGSGRKRTCETPSPGTRQAPGTPQPRKGAWGPVLLSWSGVGGTMTQRFSYGNSPHCHLLNPVPALSLLGARTRGKRGPGGFGDPFPAQRLTHAFPASLPARLVSPVLEHFLGHRFAHLRRLSRVHRAHSCLTPPGRSGETGSRAWLQCPGIGPRPQVDPALLTLAGPGIPRTRDPQAIRPNRRIQRDPPSARGLWAGP